MDEPSNTKHFKFDILQKDKKTKARLGRLTTPHGDIETPMFIPVGTQASVKSLSPKELQESGAQIVLANTYHLYLRPGENIIEKFNGLGSFMGWPGPTMTDSGGFQVFSLGAAHHIPTNTRLTKFSNSVFLPQDEKIEEGVENVILSEAKDPEILKQVQNEIKKRIKPAIIDEEGVTFYSHLDGNKKRLTPKISVRIQESLGADLIVAFDDHESPLWNYEKTKESLERSNRWCLESKAAQKRKDQLMYGVVHGGMFEDLRKESAKFTNEHFAAVAIGGVYTSKEKLYNVLDWCVPFFDEGKPRHLLGIGEPQDILEGVAKGMDFFDCVAPTRRARHGTLYISPKSGGNTKNRFSMHIVNAQFAEDKDPIDANCRCYTCLSFSKAYLHHLFRAKELLGYRLASLHNIHFILDLTKQIREAIAKEKFNTLMEKWL